MKRTSRSQKASTAFQFTTPYSEKQLSTANLHSGNAYQRPVHMKDVMRIVNDFDPKRFESVVVSYREGKFNVVDGQHRIAALKIMNGGADCMINCKVIYGLTYEEEADLYAKLDACKKRLSIVDATRAKAESKSDPNLNNIQKVLKANGIKLVFYSIGGTIGGRGKNRTTAIRAITSAYTELGILGFDKMVRLIKNTWDGDKDSLTMYIISGMALFVKTYGQEIDEKYFIKKLSAISPKEIITEGKSDISAHQTSLKYARVIWNKYNARNGKKTLEYKFQG